jgi:dolichyl-diphosphooligosaccharide--protein glycosyltransferase
MDLPDRKYKEYAVLFSIFLVALALRLVTAKYDLLLGADPWVHYFHSKNFLELGRNPLWDYSIYYPAGTWTGSVAGLHALPAIAYNLIGFTGISFFKTFQILPALFGGLICIPLYFLTREITDRRTGLIAAMLFAISPAGISRTLAGYYRGESFFVVLMLFTFLFYLYSQKKDKFIFAGALMFLLCTLFWTGWPYLFAVLSFSALLLAFQNYIKGIKSYRPLLSYSLISGIGMTVYFLYVLHRRSYTAHINWLSNQIFYIYGAFFAAILLLLFFILGTRIRSRKSRLIALLPIVLITLLVIPTFELSGRYTPFGYILNYFTISDSFITEKVGFSSSTFFQNYNILAIFLPIGFLVFFKKFRDPIVFTYFVTAAFLFMQQTRFYFLASPVICLLGAAGVNYLVEKSKKKLNVLILILLIFNVIAANNFVSEIEPFVGDDLYESLIWLKDNSPEDSGVFTWWDYTGPVISIAERRAVLLSNPYRGRLDDFARLLATGNEEEAVNISKKYKVDYILIDDRIFLSWDRISAYAGNENILNSTFRNMYTNKPLENFKLEYDNGGVKIYSVAYGFTKISTLETDKFYYKPGEEMRIKVRFRSNEMEKGKVVLSYSVFEEVHELKENEPLYVTVHAPSDLTRGGITATLYDISMEKAHDRRGQEFVTSDELLRMNTEYLVDQIKSRVLE